MLIAVRKNLSGGRRDRVIPELRANVSLSHEFLEHLEPPPVLEIRIVRAPVRPHSSPLEQDFFKQRVPRLDIGFSRKALDERLQLSARIPHHRLMQIVNIAVATKIR